MEEKQQELDLRGRHHIWCNNFMLPVADCALCDRLCKEYPENCSPDALLAKHFPEAIVVN